MKKLLAFICALVMVLSLCACASTSSNDTADETPVDAAPAEDSADTADEAPAAEADGEITTVEAGKLTISTSPDFPPYEYLDDNGDIVGIEIDIMNLIAEKLGLELQIDAMDFDSALLAVQQGKSDVVVSGVTVTDDRKLVMNFTDSYTTAVQVIIVPEGSEVTLDNLGEQQIGTQLGTTGYLYTVDDYGEDHVTGYNTYTLVVQALLNEQIDCIVMDDAVAREYVAANPGLVILDTSYADEDYAFGVDKTNDALTEAVNNALGELIADGTVESIIAQYIGD